jgi:hypothetical protein
MHQVVVGKVYVFSSDDLRALIEHLRGEAPHLLSSLVVAAPDAEAARRLAASGVTALVSTARETGGGVTNLIIGPPASDAMPLSVGGVGALGTWRFWAVAGVAVIDAVVIIPVAMTTLLFGALWFPGLLRRAARFLGSLATAAEAPR